MNWAVRLSFVAFASMAVPVYGITTSMGQSWNFMPDAWGRGNTSSTAYFGWDQIEATGPPTGPFGSFKLDDASPDLGFPTSATSTRIVQSDASFAIYGHRSASGNYYSGFPDNAVADEFIRGMTSAPPGESVGFTTVVLQAIGQPGSAVDDLTFTMENGASWTKQKSLYALNTSGAGLYWQEWTAPGANLPFSIHMQSAASSRGLDAFQVDSHWSASGPVVNSITAIPEPPSEGLLILALLTAAFTRARLL
jgi:hypothetical protein